MARGHGRSSRYSGYTGGPDPLAPPVDLREALEAIGQDVMETGWYRRSPTPFVELRTLEVGGDVRTCWVRAAKLFVAALAVAAGMILAVA